MAINPQLSGNYSTTKLAIEVLGPYGLTRKEGFIPLSLELKAYPRLLAAVIRAALFLLKEGEGGRGEKPTPFKGPGTEYADTRTYLPGDTLHHHRLESYSQEERANDKRILPGSRRSLSYNL